MINLSNHLAPIWIRKKAFDPWARGFTLVEMLIVIAIIVIIASFLVPALHKANAMAKAVTCSNNMRQLYFAFNTYTETFNGYFPCYAAYGQTSSNTMAWPYSIAAACDFPVWLSPEWDKRSSSIFFCPIVTASNVNRYDRISYGSLLYGVLNNGREPGVIFQGIANWHPSLRISRVRRAGQTYLLGDISVKGVGEWTGWAGWGTSSSFLQRHGLFDNVLYVDGHVNGYMDSMTLLPIHFNSVYYMPEAPGEPYRYGD